MIIAKMFGGEYNKSPREPRNSNGNGNIYTAIEALARLGPSAVVAISLMLLLNQVIPIGTNMIETMHQQSIILQSQNALLEEISDNQERQSEEVRVLNAKIDALIFGGSLNAAIRKVQEE